MFTQYILNYYLTRGGIGATLGAIGAQLPYPYVHIVYWTVQLLLGITAIQSGCEIGIKYYTKVNGTFLCVLFSSYVFAVLFLYVCRMFISFKHN